MTANDKAMTLRLPTELAEDLKAIATVDQQTVSEVVRAAIATYVDTRKSTPDFQAAVRARITSLGRLASEQEAPETPPSFAQEPTDR